MSEFRMGQAADLLGVSVDTLRRWADAGRVATERTSGKHRVVEGAELARFAAELAGESSEKTPAQSARNRFTGLVTKVTKNEVMAQIEVQAGPHRIVSLISREAADELGLEPGVLTTAVVKSTNVVIQRPDA